MMNNSTSSAMGRLFAHVLIQDGMAVVAVAGEIDMTTDETPLSEAETVLSRAPAGLVVDLQAVSFFDSSGINLLVVVQQQAQRRGVPFAVVAAHQAVVKPLQLTGMDKVITLFPNLPNALAALRATPGSLPPQRRR